MDERGYKAMETTKQWPVSITGSLVSAEYVTNNSQPQYLAKSIYIIPIRGFVKGVGLVENHNTKCIFGGLGGGWGGQ